MNRHQVIARNRDALLRIVAVLFVYAGLDEGGEEGLPRRVWRKILRLLRPAKSAARRLIVIGYLNNGGILQTVLRDLAGFFPQ